MTGSICLLLKGVVRVAVLLSLSFSFLSFLVICTYMYIAYMPAFFQAVNIKIKLNLSVFQRPFWLELNETRLLAKKFVAVA